GPPSPADPDARPPPKRPSYASGSALPPRCDGQWWERLNSQTGQRLRERGREGERGSAELQSFSPGEVYALPARAARRRRLRDLAVARRRRRLPRLLDVARGGRAPSARMTGAPARYELRDAQGGYRGTFVTDDRGMEVGDVFTSGDGRVLRIVGTAVPQRSLDRPAYAGGWIVEPVEGPQ